MTTSATLATTGLILLGLFVCALAFVMHRLRQVPVKGSLDASIDHEVRKLLAQDPSMALAVGVCSSQRSFVKGYGSLVPGIAQPPDGTTVFQIASVSKLFTALLLQLLCDEGVVSLDATLGELIGDHWPLAASVRGVTLRQLATHTSGFPSVPKPLLAEAALRAADQPFMSDPYKHLEPGSIFRYLATAPDKTAAGRFNYSNFGMGLLGHVLEEVLGQGYESLVVQKVLDPLGMQDTRVALTPDRCARLAPGHDARGRPAGLWHFKALAGAGAFASTAQDLLTFVAASLSPGGPAAAAFEAMRQPQFDGRTGLGWMQPGLIDRIVGNGGIVWHNGMVGGYASYVSIDPQTRTGIVVLLNKSVDVTLLGARLTRLVRARAAAAARDAAP